MTDIQELLGIVSRGDLLRVFLRSDDAIREEITRDLLHRTLGLEPADVAVEERDGLIESRHLPPTVEPGQDDA
jgi:hypothetical protein